MTNQKDIEAFMKLLSQRPSGMRLLAKRRVIQGSFTIRDDIVSLETERDPNLRRPDQSFLHLTGVGLPYYNFPQWDSDRQNLVETVAALDKCSGNAIRRQIIFTKLKSSISELRDKVGLGSRGFLRVLNMCHDALQNVRSEKLRKKQIKALKFVIENMRENMDDFLATELEGILLESGLLPMPIVEGIAHLYE